MTVGNAYSKSKMPGDASDDVDAEVKKFFDSVKDFFKVFDIKIGEDREVNIFSAGSKAWGLYTSIRDLVKGLKPDQDISDVYKGVTEQLDQLSKNMQERFDSVNKLVLHVVFDNKVTIPSNHLWGSLMDYYKNPTKSFKDTFILECKKQGPAVPIMARARDLLPNILNHTKKELIGEWDQVIYMAAFKMMFVNIQYLMLRWPEAENDERNQEYIKELNTVIYDIIVLLNEKDGKKTEPPPEVEAHYVKSHQAVLA